MIWMLYSDKICLNFLIIYRLLSAQKKVLLEFNLCDCLYTKLVPADSLVYNFIYM